GLERVRSSLANPSLYDHGAEVVTCHAVTVSDCTFTADNGLRFGGSTREAVVEHSRVLTQSEEFCSDITYRDCDFVTRFSHDIGPARIRAEGCRFFGITIFGFSNPLSPGEELVITDCDMFAPGIALTIYADRCRLQDIRVYGGDLPVQFAFGVDHYVRNVQA